MSGVCEMESGKYFLPDQVLSVCQVHAHYCYFHHQCVLSCAAVCSLVIVLRSELVELQPRESFLSLSFPLIYS